MAPQTTNVPTALTLNTFTRAGYSFSGTGTNYANGAIYPFTADATLYAQWTALPILTIKLSLSPAADTYITAVGTSPSITNYGTCPSLGLANTLGSVATYRRPLLRYNLSAIPGGATIVSASMDLYASYVEHPATANAHRVTSDWDEGTSSCATNGIANWANRKAGPIAWIKPGGDYDAGVAASVAVSAVGTYSFDLTALAQNWVDGTYANYGVLLEQPTQAGYGEISWQSKETFNPAQAPKLIIVYTTDRVTDTSLSPDPVFSTSAATADMVMQSASPQ